MRFLIDAYHMSNWTGVYFTHSDVADEPHHAHAYQKLRKFFSSAMEWPRWPIVPGRGAVLDRHSCGCEVVSERPRSKGYLWKRPMMWWSRAFLGSALPDRLDWPRSFIFAIDATTVRSRSLHFYQALLELGRRGVMLYQHAKVDNGTAGVWMLHHAEFHAPALLGHSIFERLPGLFFNARDFPESSFGTSPLHDHCQEDLPVRYNGRSALACVDEAVDDAKLPLPQPAKLLVRGSGTRVMVARDPHSSRAAFQKLYGSRRPWNQP